MRGVVVVGGADSAGLMVSAKGRVGGGRRRERRRREEWFAVRPRGCRRWPELRETDGEQERQERRGAERK